MKLNNSKFIIHNSTLLLFFALALLLLTSCEQGTNPPSNNKITLTFEDASCTEAWLNLKLDNITLPTKVNIVKNDSTIITANINSNDTILFIENLLPSQTYTFKASSTQHSVTSNKLPVNTMDTTSHNFTWQTFTFGGVSGSSYLKDVAIINENNIWAVGEIHTAETDQWNADSTNWVQPYNAVHWDGSTWELKRIMFYTFCNQEHKAPYPARAVFSFNNGVVAITSGSQITYIENGEQKNIECIPVSVNAIWGTSGKDFYVVGKVGNIAHYNGSSWTKIESGTELSINDIYGDYNSKTNKWEVLAVAANLLQSSERDILRITNNTVELLDEVGINWSLASIWFKSMRKYFVVGSGIYTKKDLSSKKWDNSLCSLTNYYTHSICGTELNNIIITGAYNEVLYFNGFSWRSLRSLINNTQTGRLTKVKCKNNIFGIVGSNDGKGILYIGKK